VRFGCGDPPSQLLDAATADVPANARGNGAPIGDLTQSSTVAVDSSRVSTNGELPGDAARGHQPLAMDDPMQLLQARAGSASKTSEIKAEQQPDRPKSDEELQLAINAGFETRTAQDGFIDMSKWPNALVLLELKEKETDDVSSTWLSA
jgi:hypothetical protein